MGAEVSLALRHEIETCRILFGCTFDEIERKTEVQLRTTVIGSKVRSCNDFHEVLAYGDDMEKSEE